MSLMAWSLDASAGRVLTRLLRNVDAHAVTSSRSAAQALTAARVGDSCVHVAVHVLASPVPLNALVTTDLPVASSSWATAQGFAFQSPGSSVSNRSWVTDVPSTGIGIHAALGVTAAAGVEAAPVTEPRSTDR